MDLYEVADQIMRLLQQRGRLTYRVLKLQFELDDETLEALKEEILYSQPQAPRHRKINYNSSSVVPPFLGQLLVRQDAQYRVQI